MSIRSILALLIVAPLLAVAGGGIVLTPGSGWQISRSSSPNVPNWVDPNAANLAIYLSCNTNADGTIRDWSGNGNTATNSGSTLTIVSTNKGQVQYSFNLDGSDDYLQFASTSLNACTNNFTIAIWTYYDTATEFEAIVSRQYPTVDYSPKIDWSASANNYRMYYFRTASLSDVITGPARIGVPNNTNWVGHIITHTATTNIWYTNGVFCSGAAAAGHPTTANASTIWQIGRAGTGSYYDGQFTEFRIYNKALSESEALELSQNSHPLSNNVVRTP